MNDTLEIREARADEIALVQELIREMAKYEKRPEDMTGTQEALSYWLFERKIATILLLEYDKKVIGYAIYYPVFGSFAACGGIHLEDLYIKAEYRKHGFGIPIVQLPNARSPDSSRVFRWSNAGGSVHWLE